MFNDLKIYRFCDKNLCLLRQDHVSYPTKVFEN
jgi:hypothetical protein